MCYSPNQRLLILILGFACLLGAGCGKTPIDTTPPTSGAATSGEDVQSRSSEVATNEMDTAASEDEREIARQQVFAANKTYFIWPASNETIESASGNLTVDFNYELNPSISDPPATSFACVMVFVSKSADTGDLWKREASWVPDVKDLKAGRTFAFARDDGSELEGDGEATIYLKAGMDSDTSISNEITVPIAFK